MSARAIIEAALVEVQNELVHLARVLNLSDEEKASDAARHYAYTLPDWAVDNDVTLPGDAEDDPYSALEHLEANDPENFKAFAAHAMQSAVSDGSAELPWMMMSFTSYVSGEWLIHFSDDAQRVWDSGFKYGVDPYDHHRLALSTHSSDRVRRKSPGLNFAYLASDAGRYGGSRHGRRGDMKYGQEAVMFRAAGVKVWHYGDEEPQVIFLGSTAHDPVYLYKNEGNWAVGDRPGGGPVFQAEDLDDVINWVEQNYDQYRKSLRPSREKPTTRTRPKPATAAQSPAAAPGTKAVAAEADRLLPAAR